MLPMNSRFRSPSPGQAARAVELLGQEIASHLGQTDLRWLTCNERPYLYIPQHRPLACTPPTPKRRLFGDKPAPEFYEETTTLLINYLIGRFTPQVFFDIGAAKGYFARVAASHCAHAPRVHAFEMQPHLHAQLSERLRDDAFGHKVTAHHAALTDRHYGEAAFWYARSRLFERSSRANEGFRY